MEAEKDAAQVASSDAPSTASPLTKLTDLQVFSRDPEKWDQESLEDAIERITRIVLRHRKARQDQAEMTERAAKLAKHNAKAKPKKKEPAGDPFEEKVR